RNEEALQRCGRNRTHPQWWVTWAIQLPTSMIWDWRLGRATAADESTSALHVAGVSASRPGRGEHRVRRLRVVDGVDPCRRGFCDPLPLEHHAADRENASGNRAPRRMPLLYLWPPIPPEGAGRVLVPPAAGR